MTTHGEQFSAFNPRPRGGPRPGAGRKPDDLHQHSRHGQVGTLSAIARDLGVSPAALAMQRKRREDFPAPVVGNLFKHTAVRKFRG